MNTISIVNLVLALCAVLFYFCGCIGNSEEKDDIMNVGWVTGTNGNQDVYFGLKAYTCDGGGCNDKTYTYKKDNGIGIFAVCEVTGETTVAMTALALLCAIAVSVIAVMGMMGKSSPNLTTAGVACSLCSILFGVIGFSSFANCHNFIDDDSGLDDVAYGPGMALSLIAFLFMLISFVLNVLPMFGIGIPGADAPAEGAESKPVATEDSA